MMEELAKLIAAKPMAMTEDGSFGFDQSVSSGGLQGGDWASALTQTLTRDMGQTPGQTAGPAPANKASRAYDAVKSHVAAFINRTRGSNS